MLEYDAARAYQCLPNNILSLGITSRTKVFIRFPRTLFETEDALQLKKQQIGTRIHLSESILVVIREYS